MKISLYKQMFCEKEKVLACHGDIAVSTFKFSTGIEGLKIQNKKGFLTLLPFKGQQIWRAEFCEHKLVMKTMFDEPTESTDFLHTYGAFLIHCGLTAIGNPSPEDTHPLHGELPNARYEKAFVEFGEDENGKYAEMSGEFEYRIGFEVGYKFIPHCRLYENEMVFHIHNDLVNLRTAPQEYLYLCHINFLPVDGSELVYSAKKENVYTHYLVPDNMPAEDAKKLDCYFDKLKKDVTVHNKIDSTTQFYEPEIVFTVKYEKDENGNGHCLQVLPDGYACYVSHKPDELPYGIRWIARNADEDAIGMLLPATGEHNGYLDCVKNGYVRHLPPKGTVSFHFTAGLLEPKAAKEKIDIIKKLI